MRVIPDDIAYEIDDHSFDYTQKPDRFFYKLGIPKKVIEKVLGDIDSYYGEREEIKTYADGTPKTKRGIPQARIIHPSYRELRWIQDRIKDRILSRFQYPINIQGGLKKRDNIQNARLHLGKKYHLCTDLSDFFPSVSHTVVYERLIELGFSADVAGFITRFTTYKGCLPQGIPTSTHLANLVFYPLDSKLIHYCEERDIFYSRFVDDMAFSSQRDFKHLTDDLLSFIHDSDFKINHRKTYYCEGKVLITGILVGNNVLEVKDAIKQKLIDPEVAEQSRKALKQYRDRVRS